MFRRAAQSPWSWEDVNAVFVTLMRIEAMVSDIHAEVVGDDGEEEQDHR